MPNLSHDSSCKELNARVVNRLLLYTSVVIASLIVCIAFIQLALAVYFYSLVKSKREETKTFDEPDGLVSVIMSVRGCDPTLRFAVEGLLKQDYSNYDIHLIVDHRDDSAWSVVHALKERYDINQRMTIHEMRTPVDTCGLKCNALVQAMENIDSTTEYLALIDADVTPHEQWLSQLLSPLTDPKIGVVTGNQWFDPNSPSTVGSLIRSLWNAGAIVPTAIYNNPWAGTFAMRMADVRRARLAEVWQRSVVDDGPIRQAIAPLGLKIMFHPSLIMVNREKCTLKYVNTYVTRMLTWSKLHEKTFVNTVIHAAFSNALLLATLATMCLAWMWNPLVAAIAFGAFAANSTISLMAYLVVRRGVQQSCQMRGETLPAISLVRMVKLAFLVPVTQFLYGKSCFRAIVSQQVKWREITYEVKSKSQVRMLQYAPMLAEPEQAQSKVSI